MVQFAVSSMFFHEYPLEEIFSFVVEAGCDSVEFWVETPSYWMAGQPEDELVYTLQKFPELVSPTMHAPILDLNPTSINPAVAEISVRYTVEAVRLAARAGIRVVTVHPGRRTAKRPPGAPDYTRFGRYIRALEEAAKEQGVRVSMENMEPKVNSLLCTPEDMRELLDREPWLWFTLDISHALGAGPEEVRRYIDLCGDRLANVHVGGSSNGRMHLPVDGDEGIAGILCHLLESGYKDNLTLELEDRNFTHDLSAEEKVLVIARELAFMRDCLV
ncbi:MAG: fructoselysine 3-epimerase [Methanoregulaceae archaeon PtaB.Bin056]|jgi:sugar phosphate isomerase/epimerase|nr:MAG: fructoselysine 3-epimerase [Methanoregulaceae archaeon PtaB.Bin056]